MSDTPRFAVPVLPENSDPGKPLRRVTRTEYEAFRRRPVLLPVAECSQFSLLLEDHEALDDELFKLRVAFRISSDGNAPRDIAACGMPANPYMFASRAP